MSQQFNEVVSVFQSLLTKGLFLNVSAASRGTFQKKNIELYSKCLSLAESARHRTLVGLFTSIHPL